MKKIPLLLLEFLAVICLITILIYFGVNKYNELFNNFPKYTVRFKDIDGLCIGAPVRLAGVHVGHVVRQELEDNKVLITFKVVNKKAKIPKGSTAGIESTGLAGSKSLEIKPPESENPGGAILQPVGPLRIDSIKEIISILSEATLDFSESVFSFLDKNAQDAGSNLKKTTEYIQKKTRELELSGERIENAGKNAIRKTKKVKEMVKETSDNIENIKKTMENIDPNEKMADSIDTIKTSTEKLTEFIEKGEARQKIQAMDGKLRKFNEKTAKLNEKINKIKNKELGYLNEFNESLKSTAEKMQKWIDSFEKKQD